jgi:hypothetical protein
MAQTFYKDLFNSDPHVDANKVLESILIQIDQTTNEGLCKSYTKEEIRGALFQMGPTMAPGPYGFSAMFYQKHWKILEKDICNVVRAFLGREEIPEGLCDTIIILIPKVSRSDRLTNFQPISLCNVLYKIASKVLAKILNGVLPSIIAEQQSAFVPSRLITNNVLIAYECMHTIRRQKWRNPFFASKIDMIKAYDRVEWTYLEGILQKMDFEQTWVKSVTLRKKLK